MLFTLCMINKIIKRGLTDHCFSRWIKIFYTQKVLGLVTLSDKAFLFQHITVYIIYRAAGNTLLFQMRLYHFI